MYFAGETVTTIFGDITAQTAAEQMVALFIMLVGVFFFSFLISSMADLMNVRLSRVLSYL